MPVLIGDTERRSQPRKLPGSQTIYDHFMHREMGENKLGWTSAIFRTAAVFEISPVAVENAILDIELLHRHNIAVH